MKKYLIYFFAVCLLLSVCSACGSSQRDLVDMQSVDIQGIGSGVVWEGRTYAPFCVVSKNDRGEQIGIIDGDPDQRISAYKGYSTDEWLVSWMPMDGGAMLLKEQSVINIPDGLEPEYQ